MVQCDRTVLFLPLNDQHSCPEEAGWRLQAEITWSQLFPTHASPSVSVEEMVDSSCFCVKIGSESRLNPYKQLAGGEMGSTQEMYVFGKTKRERERV